MRRRWIADLALLGLVFCVGLYVVKGSGPFRDALTATRRTVEAILPGLKLDSSANPQDRAYIQEVLRRVPIVEERHKADGYKRENFGKGWGRVARSGIDLGGAAQVAGSENSAVCSTREAVMLEQLDPQRVNGCDALDTTAVDPYTDKPLDIHSIEIDHLVPLRAAWDLGATAWAPQQRQAFANDRALNLIAVDHTVNQDKSDGTPGEWMPPANQCWYGARYVRVIDTYGLALTVADYEVLSRVC